VPDSKRTIPERENVVLSGGCRIFARFGAMPLVRPARPNCLIFMQYFFIV
jgi:hypothetical protein